jgi:hypothetical protein
MPATYEPIETRTLASAAASVTFTSIPSTYTDLILVMGNLTFSSGGNPQVQYNGDTATNYSNTDLYGTGSTDGSTYNVSNNYINVGFSATNGSASEPATVIVQIQNYSNATTFKTLLGRGNRAGGEVQTNVGMWRSTAAINQVLVKTSSTFQTGSTFTVYGIKAA